MADYPDSGHNAMALTLIAKVDEEGIDGCGSSGVVKGLLAKQGPWVGQRKQILKDAQAGMK